MLRRIRRLLFLYVFRDFDKGSLDAGLEYTTLAPLQDSKVLCKAITFNVKGLRHDSFLVNASNRSIVNLPGRYICYWVNGKNDSEQIYSRTYQKQDGGTYVHVSRDAKSQLAYDEEGLEKAAENLVSRPRRYHEKFIRILRF